MNNRAHQNAEGVLTAGERMYKMAAPFVSALFGAIIFIFTISVIFVFIGDSDELPLYLALSGETIFLDVMFGASYFLIAIGLLAVPFYLMGLHFVGLGQIALNTLPDDGFGVASDNESASVLERTWTEPAWNPEPQPEVHPVVEPAPAPVEKPRTAPSQATPGPFNVPVDDAPPAKRAASPMDANQRYSLALYNSLKRAVETETDEALVACLEHSAAKLKAPHEKQLIRQIMNRPTGKIRAVVDRVYQELSRAWG